ncbi:MAG TPA: sigma-70 family RNA polymerase sigma factor, partial [Polyangiaceae bacterium]|nr:sigma-70 family RNA polymerase sigma factor [Polyangiaceae bacterium]
MVEPIGEPSDEEILERVSKGDIAAFELVMRRYNRRLFRAVRAILKDDAEVEDVIQEAYVSAYAHLADFSGRARFSTWLTRIAVHEAFGRLRKRRRSESWDANNGEEEQIMTLTPSPE